MDGIGSAREGVSRIAGLIRIVVVFKLVVLNFLKCDA